MHINPVRLQELQFINSRDKTAFYVSVKQLLRKATCEWKSN